MREHWCDNTLGPVELYLLNKIKKEGTIHLSLIDPEITRPKEAVAIAKILEDYGTSAIMIGGSTIASVSIIDEVVKAIKENVNIPVILFPSNLTSISKHADAILFMSLLNSNNPMFITGFQALAAPIIKKHDIETISLAYIIIGGESTAAYIGRAHTIPYEANKIATSYALAGEYLGTHFIYLEAGSGSKHSISPKMIAMVKKNVTIPVIVGGGIRDWVNADLIAKAGADAIVTGTVIENDVSGRKIGKIINGIKNAKNH
jgi:phosphoglycerol geranylgeranyltransferase